MRMYIKYEPDSFFAHPEDMKKILAYLRKHGDLRVSEATVENMYYEFSETRYATWLSATDENIKDFANWLSEIDL